jgi:subtilase family serine protease
MFWPTEQAYYTAMQAAANAGFVITHTASNRMAFQVDATVADIEKAFHVTMNSYQHPTENRAFYAPDREPTMNFGTPMWHVGNMDNYSIPRPMVGFDPNGGVIPNATGSGPGGNFLQSDFRPAYYGTGPLDGSGQSVGLLEFAPYNPAGVALYFSTFGPANTTAVNPISVDGTPPTCSGSCANQNSGSIEAALDIEVPIAFAPKLTAVNVYVGSDVSGVAELSRMVTDNNCKQISCSWLWKPADPVSVDPYFMEMAAQGQSFYTASGDNGSYISSDFIFPAEDANQIAVGGTNLVTDGPAGPWKSETGWIDSGGGPSLDHIAIPSWQKNQKVVTGTNGASRLYRNLPDVAAEGNFDNEICYDSTCQGGWGGTSFAAPRWAAYTALANQQAVSKGKPLIGFANPDFYRIFKGNKYNANFHDILTGNNGAFSCVAGYDLVTGIGSMNGAKLINTLTK